MSSTNLPNAGALLISIVLALNGLAAPNGNDFDKNDAKHHYDFMSIYLTGMPSPTAPIVIVLHGDAPFVNPSRQYAFASNLADAVPGTRVVTLLRPGSADPYGAPLGGGRAVVFGENYTLKVVDDIARGIQSVQSSWKATAVILVGDSGGAAVAAYVAALHPALVQQLVLLGCPCDVPALRSHIGRSQRNPMSLLAVHSLSPLQTLDFMGKGTKVTAISGTNDSITLPQYARSYVAKAAARGISASMIMIPSRGHEIMNDAVVIENIANAVRDNR